MRRKLQRLRQLQGYTQETFAAAIGMSKGGYQKVEEGVRETNFTTMKKIKETLAYYDDDLFDNDPFYHPRKAQNGMRPPDKGDSLKRGQS